MVRLYTTGCPLCKMLERAMTQKGIQFEMVLGEDALRSIGYDSAPVLEVDGTFLTGNDAKNWIREN